MVEHLERVGFDFEPKLKPFPNSDYEDRGKNMLTKAIYPDGREEVLLYVPHYDFRWQETYFLKKQFLLPKGTKLMTIAYFDNSKNNFQNPDPSKAVRWGEPSDEEMMGFWLQFADPQMVAEKAALTQK